MGFVIVYGGIPEVVFLSEKGLNKYLKKEKLGSYKKIQREMKNGVPKLEVYETTIRK